MIATRNPSDTLDLSPSVSVNALIHRYPSLLAVLDELGIDTCCGGGESLECAALTAQIPLDRLMEDVSAAVERTVVPAAPHVGAAARRSLPALERRRNR